MPKLFESGSTLYYALNLVEPSRKAGFITLCELFKALYSIRNIEEKSVALAKFAWWQQAILHFLNGEPVEHPLLCTLAIEQKKYHILLPVDYFERLLQGLHWHIQYQGFETFEDLEQYAAHLGGGFTLLLSHWLGYTQNGTLLYAENLGKGLLWSYQLQQVGLDAREGRLYFAKEDLMHCHLTEANLLSLEPGQAWETYLLFWVEQIQTTLRSALKQLPKEDRLTQKAGIFLGNLALAWLKVAKSDPSSLFKQKIELTPLKKAWIGFKTQYQS